jgi:hypothetical protein
MIYYYLNTQSNIPRPSLAVAQMLHWQELLLQSFYLQDA